MTTLSMHHVIRTTLRAMFCLVCVLGIATAPAQAQDNLIAYFPLDGDPAPGQFYAPGGEPQTVPGKIGEALLFGGDAVIALPHDLGQYHQLTFTAWVKITDPELMDGKLVSSGASSAPELILERGNLDLRAGRRSLDTNERLPVGEWIFVAGVADFSASEARIHQGEIVETSSGVMETDLSRLQAKAYEDPNDPQADKQRFIFIGARDFDLSSTAAHPARGIAIDDVRIYNAVLGEDEIKTMRTNPEPLAIGPYPPQPDDEEDQDPGAGGDADEDSDGEGDADGDAGDDGDGQSDDDEDDPKGKLVGLALDDEFTVSSLSGDFGERTKTVDLQTVPVQELEIRQNSGAKYMPCALEINSEQPGTFSFEVNRLGAGDRGADFLKCSNTLGFGRELNIAFEEGYYLQSLRVCQNRRQNNRIKGVQASAVRVTINEATNEIAFRDVATGSASNPNCKDLRQTIRCEDDEVASGVRVRYDERNNGTASFTGLELVCRKVIGIYE